MSKIYFFRHAQASAGKENYDVLSDKGEEQAKILGEHLVTKRFSFDRVYSGPLVRQRHTCEIVGAAFAAQGRSIPTPIILDGLKEHEGPAAMKTALPKLLETDTKIQTWWAEGQKDPARRGAVIMRCFQYFMSEWAAGKIVVSGFTPWSQFRQAANDALNTIKAQTSNGETIAVFTSGGTISAITGTALGIPDERTIAELNYSVRNTSFTSFFYSKRAFNLLGFNEIPHLEGEMVTFV